MPSYLIALWVGVGVAIVALAVGLVLTGARVRRLEQRYQRMMEGASAQGLEEILLEHLDHMRTSRQEVERLSAEVAAQNATLSRAIQHVSLVRFNPFDDTGGNYSFALALADDEGTGVVLCSLHGRGNTRLYAKPIVDWASPMVLSEEEQQAVSLLRPHPTQEGE